MAFSDFTRGTETSGEAHVRGCGASCCEIAENESGADRSRDVAAWRKAASEIQGSKSFVQSGRAAMEIKELDNEEIAGLSAHEDGQRW